MGFIITFEAVPDDDPQIRRLPTRKELAQKLGCHFNTLRADELAIKEWVDDAKKYYTNPNPKKLEGVELNPYLIWLLLKARGICNRDGRKKLAPTLFQNPEHFTEKAFEDYVLQQQQQHANRQVRRIDAA